MGTRRVQRRDRVGVDARLGSWAVDLSPPLCLAGSQKGGLLMRIRARTQRRPGLQCRSAGRWCALADRSCPTPEAVCAHGGAPGHAGHSHALELAQRPCLLQACIPHQQVRARSCSELAMCRLIHHTSPDIPVTESGCPGGTVFSNEAALLGSRQLTVSHLHPHKKSQGGARPPGCPARRCPSAVTAARGDPMGPQTGAAHAPRGCGSPPAPALQGG